METLFDWVCHRNPARCFPGAIFLCARCLGMYLGALVGALGVIALWAGRLRPPSKVTIGILVAGIAATPVEVALELCGLSMGSNPLRFSLGVALGTSLVAAMGLSLNLARVQGGRLFHPLWLSVLGLVDAGLIAGVLARNPGFGLKPIAFLGVLALLITTLLVLGRMILSRTESFKQTRPPSA